MRKTFKVKEVCKTCNGTGLYIGMGERDGAAIVCNKCKGTGCYIFEYAYEEFIQRKEPITHIERVYIWNPGVVIGNAPEKGITLESFGGIPYKEWLSLDNPLEFPPKTEDRKFYCPAQWYQNVDDEKKPNCEGLLWGDRFSDCKLFERKEECWKKWDDEHTKEI